MFVLETNPSILYPLVDRLRGGSGEALTAERPLTEPEWDAADAIAGVILAELARAWGYPAFLTRRREVYPNLFDVFPAGDPVVLVSFEMCLGEASGFVNICLPAATADEIAARIGPTGE